MGKFHSFVVRTHFFAFVCSAFFVSRLFWATRTKLLCHRKIPMNIAKKLIRSGFWSDRCRMLLTNRRMEHKNGAELRFFKTGKPLKKTIDSCVGIKTKSKGKMEKMVRVKAWRNSAKCSAWMFLSSSTLQFSEVNATEIDSVTAYCCIHGSTQNIWKI